MILARRRFLANMVAAPFVVRSASRALARTGLDIAIVGAGAAGLMAAHAARDKGLSAKIFEARSRIGGRVFTDDSLGADFEAGAFYIHFAERNPWREVARSLDARMTDVGTFRGTFEAFRNGVRLPAEDRARRGHAYSRLAAKIDQESDGEDMSFADAVSDYAPELEEAIRSLSLLSTGEDPERVSVQDYDELDSGGDLVLPGGYGRLVEAYGRGLDISLATPVSAIDYSGSTVKLTTPSGVIEARAAIVTVPIGVLKAGAIRFTPELPAPTRGALDGLTMGALSKVALRVEGTRFDLPSWTYYLDQGDPGAAVSFSFWPFDRPLVVANFGGDFARGLAKAGEKVAVDVIRARLVGILGADAGKSITGGRLAGWSAEPFSLGGYSVALPDHAGARKALEAPIADKLWLAGEANAGAASMTAGGAGLAGRRAVDEVARRLASSPKTGD